MAGEVAVDLGLLLTGRFLSVVPSAQLRLPLAQGRDRRDLGSPELFFDWGPSVLFKEEFELDPRAEVDPRFPIDSGETIELGEKGL